MTTFKMLKFPKAQSWTIDITLGIIVFMAAFFVFYALLNANPSAKASNLKEEASSVIRQIASEETPLSVVDGDEVIYQWSDRLPGDTPELGEVMKFVTA